MVHPWFIAALFGQNIKLLSDKKKYEKQLLGKIIRASQSALENNPGSGGSKKRRCAKSEQVSVSPSIVNKCANLQSKVDSMTADFSDAMVSLTSFDLIRPYSNDRNSIMNYILGCSYRFDHRVSW